MAKKKSKPIEQWCRCDFIAESARLQKDPEHDSDGVLCGAMMLAAARDGTNLKRLAKTLDVSPVAIERFHSALVTNGIFVGRKIHANWFEKGGGIEFVADVCVGVGLMERAR